MTFLSILAIFLIIQIYSQILVSHLEEFLIKDIERKKNSILCKLCCIETIYFLIKNVMYLKVFKRNFHVLRIKYSGI